MSEPTEDEAMIATVDNSDLSGLRVDQYYVPEMSCQSFRDTDGDWSGRDIVEL